MKEQIVEINIDRIELNGKGSGTFLDRAGNSKRANVPFSMDGDIVLTEVKKKRKGEYSGPLLQVVEPSKNRITARCPHFGSCGGCSWQHISIEDQLQIKQGFIQEIFREFLDETVTLKQIIASPRDWGYRNKMEFSFSQDRQNNRFLGLFLEGSRGKVFNLHTCFLVSPWFSETVVKVQKWWESTPLHAYHPSFDKGSLQNLTLREGIKSGDKMVILTVSGNPEYALNQKDLDSFKNLFSSEISVFLRIRQAIKGKPTQFFEMHLQGPEFVRENLSITLQEKTTTLNFNISPSAFFQPNTLQAENLYSHALKLADLKPTDVVFDLFCGTGTLGLLASSFVSKAIGVELSPESSLDGRENAKANGIKNVEILTNSVGDFLKQRDLYPSPSVVLLDPPRAGLDPKALEDVITLNSPTLVYISCNPKTQARDLKGLIEGGYRLKVIQPVEQFPQTPHIENIILLKK